MANRKIVAFLQSLTKKELGKFELYLQSPYFNQSDEICFIYEQLKNYIQKKTNEELSFEDYLNRHLPKNKKAITKVNLDKYLSRIYKFLLDFIAMEQFRSNEFDKHSALMEFLIEKDELQLFDKIYKKTKTILNKEKISFQNYLNQFLLERQKTNYLSVHSSNRKGNQNLQETDDALDEFYLTQKFNLAIIKKTRQQTNNENYTYNFIDVVYKYLKEHQNENNKLLVILSQAYKVLFNLQDDDKDDFKMLSNTLNENTEDLDEVIAYNFGLLICNLARHVYKNDNKCFAILFELYKIQLANNILYYKGNLFDTVFKNIVDVATRLKELDWCEKFINENSNKIIPKKHAKKITDYCKARLSFFSGKYEATRDFLQTLHFDDVYYKMAVRRLEIMVYFELKEYVYLDALINSFRVYLTPERSLNLSDTHRTLNKRFVIFISKILKLYRNSNSINFKDVKQIKFDLKQQNLTNKIWFEEKLNELIS